MEEEVKEDENDPEQMNLAVKSNDDVKDELKRNASSIATAAGIISLPIAQWFAKRFIPMHIIFFSLLGQFGLMILFVSIK